MFLRLILGWSCDVLADSCDSGVLSCDGDWLLLSSGWDVLVGGGRFKGALLDPPVSIHHPPSGVSSSVCV